MHGATDQRQTTRTATMAFLRTAPKGTRAFGQDDQTLLHRRILRLEAHMARHIPQCRADVRITRPPKDGLVLCELGHASGSRLLPLLRSPDKALV